MFHLFLPIVVVQYEIYILTSLAGFKYYFYYHGLRFNLFTQLFIIKNN